MEDTLCIMKKIEFRAMSQLKCWAYGGGREVIADSGRLEWLCRRDDIYVEPEK